MKSRKSLSVGIPAFNEEANIGYLLRDLLAQKVKGFSFKEIIVSSDGSSDKTVEIVKNIKNKKIVLFNNRKRKGQAERQNQIIKRSNSDILVLLNADILIKDKYFLKKLITPILSGRVDLTSVSVEELPAQNLMEKILDSSMKLKKSIFERIKGGQNIYTCHGRARAFSKRLYKSIKFNESVGEDAYSYLYSLKKGLTYKFVKNTEIYYKLPDNFDDHEKQSIRFFNSQKIFNKEFGENFVKEQYKIPNSISLVSLVNLTFSNPLILVYLFLLSFLKVKSYYQKNIENTWSSSESSKRLRTN